MALDNILLSRTMSTFPRFFFFSNIIYLIRDSNRSRSNLGYKYHLLASFSGQYFGQMIFMCVSSYFFFFASPQYLITSFYMKRAEIYKAFQVNASFPVTEQGNGHTHIFQ